MDAVLRSFYRRIPEEINRVVADHISDVLFPPTEKTAKKALLGEGIPEEKISITGNIIVGAVEQNLAIAQRKGDFFQQLGFTSKIIFLITATGQRMSITNSG